MIIRNRKTGREQKATKAEFDALMKNPITRGLYVVVKNDEKPATTKTMAKKESK